MDKKNILTYQGLQKLEDELQNLKVVRRKEVAQKIKEAREQGDLSENAEYDAAKDEQRDIEARIDELEKILKNAIFWLTYHKKSDRIVKRIISEIYVSNINLINNGWRCIKWQQKELENQSY